jgi:dipeptidyl aminopeptidase/acylaminoacyl peptidase
MNCATAVLLALSAVAAAAEQRPIRPEDYFALEAVSDPRISPDGTRVAFALTKVDPAKKQRRSAIWMVPADGSRPPWALTTSPQNTNSPRWSPDGRSLAFLSARPGDDDSKGVDKTQVHVLSLDGGEARRLTSAEDGVRAFAWSPDGSRLVCVIRTPPPKEDLGFERTDSRRYTGIFYKLDGVGWDDGRRSHLFVVEAASGESKQITSGPWNDTDPEWSPDGTRIAFVSDRTSGERDWEGRHSDVWVVPAAGGEAVRISDHDEADTDPAWSPDGRTLAFFGSLSEGDHPKIYLAPSAGGAPSTLASPGVDHLGNHLTWDAGGRALTFEAGAKGERHLFRVDLGSKAVNPVTRGARQVSQVDVSEKARRMVYRANDSTHPDDLYVADLSGLNERRLTRFNAALLEGLPAVERVAWKGADGWDIEGFLLKPAGWETGRKHPMVMSVHGGPNGMHGYGWLFDLQCFASRGYAVFMPNPRGSSGYGEAFQRAVTNEWGGKAYVDIMNGVEAVLKANPWIDRERLGVVGQSYGGFMTNWIVGHTTLFKAAVTMAGLSNMVSAQGERDAAYNHRRDFGGIVFDNVERYWDTSPLKYAPQVKTPTLILHGEADHRVPLAQGEEWFRALKHYGVPSELVVFPRASHAFRTAGEPKQVVEAVNWQLWWLDRYLAPGRPAS